MLSNLFSKDEESLSATENPDSINFDPGEWSFHIRDEDGLALVRQGQVREILIEYLVNKDKGHFSTFHYSSYSSDEL